jgi:hypothetical protein
MHQRSIYIDSDRADENIYTLDYLLSQPTVKSTERLIADVEPEAIFSGNSRDIDALDEEDGWIGFADGN